MAAEGGSTGRRPDDAPAHLLVVGPNPTHAGEVAAILSAAGHRISRPTEAEEAIRALSRDRPAAVIAVDEGAVAGPSALVGPVCAAAARAGVPVLMVVDDLADPGLAERLALANVDDWASRASAAAELPLRLAGLLRRRGSEVKGGGLHAVGPRLVSLVVHDLRNPLNVIGLSLRIIGMSPVRNDPELQENLRFLEENFQLMASMLQHVSDYHRLVEHAPAFEPAAFNPRWLVDDLAAELQVGAGPRASQVAFEVESSCPAEVELDPLRAKQAIQHAVANAALAAREPGTVRVVLRGGGDRWVTEVAVDEPPPPTVQSVELASKLFERICGAAAERRGVDLAIAARISELFGGSARLEVREGQGTSVVLDWPVRPG